MCIYLLPLPRVALLLFLSEQLVDSHSNMRPPRGADTSYSQCSWDIGIPMPRCDSLPLLLSLTTSAVPRDIWSSCIISLAVVTLAIAQSLPSLLITNEGCYSEGQEPSQLARSLVRTQVSGEIARVGPFPLDQPPD